MNYPKKNLFINLTQNNAFIALTHGEEKIHVKNCNDVKKHSSFFYASLEEIKKHLPTLDNIVLCVGPGSYTGIRVSISTILGLTINSPVLLFSVNSLELIPNHPLLPLQHPFYYVMMYAREDEVFVAQYDVHRLTTTNLQHMKINNKTKPTLQGFPILCYEHHYEKIKEMFEKEFILAVPFSTENMISIGQQKILKNENTLRENLKPCYLKSVYTT